METESPLRQKAREQLRFFLNECSIGEFKGKRILEIGFKNGLFLDECRKAGLVPTGIEINSEYHKKVKAEFPYLDLHWYDGGAFPVPDSSFDYVVSLQVLEHVKSIEHIFDQCIRTLKPGGLMYHRCPNYQSFYEGHYKIFWLPLLNKKTARIYLKLRGRYTPYFESLNIVKPRHIIGVLKKYKSDVNVITLGRKEFVKNFNKEQIEKIDQKLLRRAMYLLDRLTPVKNLTLKLISGTNLYYPIVMIVTKNSNFGSDKVPG